MTETLGPEPQPKLPQNDKTVKFVPSAWEHWGPVWVSENSEQIPEDLPMAKTHRAVLDWMIFEVRIRH